MPRIKKGTIFTIATGSYGDFMVHALLQATKTFSTATCITHCDKEAALIEEAEAYVGIDEAAGEILVDFLVSTGRAVKIAYTEWYCGDYGRKLDDKLYKVKGTKCQK